MNISIEELQKQKFNRLTIISEAGSDKFRRRLINTICDCGIIKSYPLSNLKNNHTQSCGCLQIDKSTTHGLTKTSEFKTWDSIKQRCNNPNNDAYKNYGGRGITVCNRWLSSFENFLSDIGKRPFQNAQIDRVDNNGNYEPTNCRWTTAKENTRNRRSTKINIDIAQDIRRVYMMGYFTQEEVAKIYGITRSIVDKVISNTRWT